MNLRDQFDLEMLRIYEEAKEFDYHANYLLRMVVDHGGLRAAKRLLSTSEVSDGFVRLWEESRLDISVERFVLKDPWSTLFTDVELAEARRRLLGVGYDFGDHKSV